MILDRLKSYLTPPSATASQLESTANNRPPSLADLQEVNWPAIHGDPEFAADRVYFAQDAAAAELAPTGAVVYTLAELDSIKGLTPSSLRLIHAAKRMGASSSK